MGITMRLSRATACQNNCDKVIFFFFGGPFPELLSAVSPRLPANSAALLASQREPARPRRKREVEHALQRRLCQPVRVRWRLPRAAQGRACDRLLDCDCQHTPPTPRPPRSGSCPDGGRGPVRAYSHEVPHKARRLAIPAPADFRSQVM